jgi:feruloyl esterase
MLSTEEPVVTRLKVPLRTLCAGASLILGLTAAAAAWPADAAPTPRTSTGASTGAIAPVLDCAALAKADFTTVPAAPSSIQSAAPLTRNGIAYCDVRGYIAPQTQFEVLLPTATWQGRYVQIGCGGLCGDVPTEGASPTPGLSTGCAAVTNGELVLASDNEGHIGASRLDGLWARNDPALREVFGFTSEHSLDQVAKAIMTRYYGTGPSYSYYDGCSDGGREALIEAQRYPADFNGILAGAPALDATDFGGELETWIYRSNTSPDGTQILTADKLPALHAAVLAACAGPDGLISDPRACAFDPASIQCPPAADTTSCLTPAQVTVARDFYAGPRDPQGQNLYPGGLPYGSELAWAGWDISIGGNGPISALATTAAQFATADLTDFYPNPANTAGPVALNDFRFTREQYERLQQAAGTLNATDPDLSAFRADGGKIILYHGLADQAIPPFGTMAYYQAVAERTPDYLSFSRLYLIPGQYHCLAGGAPQATGDLLTPLMSWVEAGQAPGAVTLATVSPAGPQPAQLTVAPFNPYAQVNGNGLNSGYDWAGRFR